MKRSIQFLVAAAAFAIAPCLSFADTQSAACATVQSCINAGVATTIAGCYAVPADPACTETNHDKYSVTAAQLATRAVAARKCDTKTFKHRSSCNACYTLAIDELSDRFFGKIFHGILAEAAREAKLARTAKCSTVPR